MTKTAFDEIKLGGNEKIKVWDMLITEVGIRSPFILNETNKKWHNKMGYALHNIKPPELGDLSKIGRVRILAVMGKKPDLLDNIRFSMSWCAPSDMKKYTRKRANTICVGRWNMAFAGEKTILNMRNTGIIYHLDTLRGFVENALVAVNGLLPKWALILPSENERLAERIIYENNK